MHIYTYTYIYIYIHRFTNMYTHKVVSLPQDALALLEGEAAGH